MPVLCLGVALLGLAIGSFLNVVIHRVPAGLSVMRPASACPGCDAPIRHRHNIPVLGWLLLRGRCADCAQPISARYPLVEAGTAALFVLTTVQVARLGLLAALPAYLFFAAVGIALSVIDLEVKRLPNSIVYPAYAVVGQFLTVASIVEGTVAPLGRALVGAVGMFAVYFAVAVARPDGLGFGDVKLAGVIGAVLGYLSYSAVLVGAVAAFAVAGLAATALIVTHRAGRKSLLPFGPAMVAGAFIALFASEPLVRTYSRLITRA